MFCPNCGAQNPDNATACSNCGFNLKQQGSAAPKFKGTMLMMNSPIAGSVPTPPGGQPATDPNEPPGRRQMKGTIVGIAPPAPGAAPAPVTPDPSTLPSGGSFAPPNSVGAVNPMSSTLVADDKPMAGFPPPSPGYGGGVPFGAAPAQPVAAPPVDVPPYQPPGGGYAPPPANQGYGAPPSTPGYGPGPAAQPGYGDPNAGGYGAPVQTPGAMMAPNFGMPSDAGAMVPVGGMGMGAPGPIGTVRNPVMVLVLTMCTFGLYGLFTMYTIENELHAFLGDGKKSSILWFLFPIIPLLDMPKVIAAARQKAGTPEQGEGNLIAYLFFGMYMIPADANKVWQQLGAKAG